MISLDVTSFQFQTYLSLCVDLLVVIKHNQLTIQLKTVLYILIAFGKFFSSYKPHSNFICCFTGVTFPTMNEFNQGR